MPRIEIPVSRARAFGDFLLEAVPLALVAGAISLVATSLGEREESRYGTSPTGDPFPAAEMFFFFQLSVLPLFFGLPLLLAARLRSRAWFRGIAIVGALALASPLLYIDAVSFAEVLEERATPASRPYVSLLLVPATSFLVDGIALLALPFLAGLALSRPSFTLPRFLAGCLLVSFPTCLLLLGRPALERPQLLLFGALSLLPLWALAMLLPNQRAALLRQTGFDSDAPPPHPPASAPSVSHPSDSDSSASNSPSHLGRPSSTSRARRLVDRTAIAILILGLPVGCYRNADLARGIRMMTEGPTPTPRAEGSVNAWDALGPHFATPPAPRTATGEIDRLAKSANVKSTFADIDPDDEREAMARPFDVSMLSGYAAPEDLDRMIAALDRERVVACLERYRPLFESYVAASAGDYLEAPTEMHADGAPDFIRLREISRFLSFRSALADSEGRREDALRDLAAILRMGGLFRSDGPLVARGLGSAFVGIGNAAAANHLARRRDDPEALADLAARLEAVAPRVAVPIDPEGVLRYEPRLRLAPAAAMLNPSYGRMLEMAGVRAAEFDVLRVAVALERLRLEVGEYPERLEELVPEYLPAVPRDPADGAPFVYSRGGEGGFSLECASMREILTRDRPDPGTWPLWLRYPMTEVHAKNAAYVEEVIAKRDGDASPADAEGTEVPAETTPPRG